MKIFIGSQKQSKKDFHRMCASFLFLSVSFTLLRDKKTQASVSENCGKYCSGIFLLLLNSFVVGLFSHIVFKTEVLVVLHGACFETENKASI